MRKRHRYRPIVLDALEDRLVLSRAAVHPLQAPTPPTQQVQQTQSLVAQVTMQVNQQFAQLANQYFQAQANYFSTPGGVAALRAAAGQLVAGLSQQVAAVLNSVEGGAGVLAQFVRARLDGDLPGSLKQDLTTIPPVGAAGLSPADFSRIATTAIENAMNGTDSLIGLYDQTLLQFAVGFFNGTGAFFTSSVRSGGGTRSSSVGNTAAGATAMTLEDRINGQIAPAFATFADQVRQAELAYFAGLGPGATATGGAGAVGPDSDLQTFATTATQLVNTLDQQVTGVLNAVPGGAGILPVFVEARLNSDLAGSLKQQLASLPAVGTAGQTQAGFALGVDQAIQGALAATRNDIQLYDTSLFAVANGFLFGGLGGFRGRRLSLAGGNGAGTTTTGTTGGGTTTTGTGSTIAGSLGTGVPGIGSTGTTPIGFPATGTNSAGATAIGLIGTGVTAVGTIGNGTTNVGTIGGSLTPTFNVFGQPGFQFGSGEFINPGQNFFSQNFSTFGRGLPTNFSPSAGFGGLGFAGLNFGLGNSFLNGLGNGVVAAPGVGFGGLSFGAGTGLIAGTGSGQTTPVGGFGGLSNTGGLGGTSGAVSTGTGGFGSTTTTGQTTPVGGFGGASNTGGLGGTSGLVSTGSGGLVGTGSGQTTLVGGFGGASNTGGLGGNGLLGTVGLGMGTGGLGTGTIGLTTGTGPISGSTTTPVGGTSGLLGGSGVGGTNNGLGTGPNNGFI
jgi:hypothetical protein